MYLLRDYLSRLFKDRFNYFLNYSLFKKIFEMELFYFKRYILKSQQSQILSRSMYF